MVALAARAGLRRAFVPFDDADEAALVDGIDIYPVDTLSGLMKHLNGTVPIPSYTGKPRDGWKKFVDAFNRKFKGKVLDKKGPPRPERSHSSLTKEVERFAGVYSQGGIPETASQGKAVGKKSKKGKKKVKAE